MGMNITNQVIASVGGAILVSLCCFRLWGLEGAVFGFINTLLLIWLFKIWNMIFIIYTST